MIQKTYFLMVALVFTLSCTSKVNKMLVNLTPNQTILYANGIDQRLLNIKELTGNDDVIMSQKKYRVKIDGESVKLIGKPDGIIQNGVSLILITKLYTGKSKVTLFVDNKKMKEWLLQVIDDDRDLDQDGLPDIAELQDDRDRKIFVDWFSQIVEIQYYDQNRRWSKGNRDCAGLARFAYIEALKKHDAEWKKKWIFFFDWAIPDVEKFNYPNIPTLGKKLFRVKIGAFAKQDLEDQAFDNFAISEKLMRYNSRYIGQAISLAQKGDLLFFKNGRNFHLMIFLGKRSTSKLPSSVVQLSPSEGKDYVVYHTGPSDNSEGEVRKVSIEALINHPNPIWRPIAGNPHFLGVYRWNILN